MKTYSAKPAEVEKKWWLVDAENIVLGRLATVVALRLRGKHKPMFTPHIDCGDAIVVVNAEKVALTGNKARDERFYWHTGYPGGVKSRSLGEIRDGAHPERLVLNAVRRMLPKGPLGREQFKSLRVYAGPDHPHEAQQPETLDLAAMSDKNSRSG